MAMRSRLLLFIALCTVFGCHLCVGQQGNTTVQRVVAGMRSDLDSMMDKLRSLEAENEELRSQLQATKQRAQAAEEALSGLNNRMSALERDLSSKLSQMQSSLANDRTQRQKEFKSLSDDMMKMLRQSSAVGTPSRSSSARGSSTPSPAASVSADKYYELEVMSGDTLSSIANAAGVSTRELIQFNQLKSANHLRVGQKLKVPVKEGHKQ